MYWYIIKCQMEDGRHWRLYRFYADFCDLQIALLNDFPKEGGDEGTPRILPLLPGVVTNSIQWMFDEYIRKLLSMPPHISKCPLVRQFFAPQPGDFEMDPNIWEDR